MGQDPVSHRPLIVHLTYVLDFGGVETLIVDCINRMPVHKYRHVIICLTRYSDFAKRITQPGVEVIALDKPSGMAPGTHVKVWKLMRRLKPAILHTYNLAAAEYALTAFLAGVPVRIHAEHGRDAGDPQGLNRKHNLLRRLLVPFIDCYIPVSADLQQWLGETVGIPRHKNLLINNGVDTERYTPSQTGAARTGDIVIGTVGRIQDVKDQANLIDAFIQLRAMLPAERDRLRLVIVGEGPLLPALRKKVEAAGISHAVSLPGASDDIPSVMRSFSIFALTSIAEGMPVTLLEAMATGLPVVSTAVGGIPELVVEGATGKLVPARDPAALAQALAGYASDPALAYQHGLAGRERIKEKYSIATMILSYTELYDSLCKTKIKLKEAIKPCAE